MLLVKPKLLYFGIAGHFCALAQFREPSAGNWALRMRRSVDFWYCQISQSYVVGNVRYTVTIDVSYTLGIVHIEVVT
jgi:hypothetical protein